MDISAKVWRYTNGKWSRQSEKLPMHRVIDRAIPYLPGKAFKTKLDAAGMTQSMSRAGRCIDNGPMEAFWGTLKAEMYYLHRFLDYDSLSAAINRYICFYNNGRY